MPCSVPAATRKSLSAPPIPPPAIPIVSLVWNLPQPRTCQSRRPWSRLQPTADGKRRIEAVVSATSSKPIAKQYGIQDIAAWLLVAQGILYYDHLMRINTVTVDKYLGADCLYHLTATE